MAERKFAGVSGPVESAAVTADYEAAAVYDKVRVGELGVYYRDGFKTRYIAFEEMDRAFIRVHGVRGRLCCGQAHYEYYRIVFVRDGKEIADVISENEKATDAALAQIAAHGVPTGFIGEEAAG
ncbi:MAG: hypothetical protein IJQ02_12615 [Oscillospiraceae bacterium]|nr:hypothetical protein [Oscillospiraceae bacterium]